MKIRRGGGLFLQTTPPAAKVHLLNSTETHIHIRSFQPHMEGVMLKSGGVMGGIQWNSSL